MKIVGIILIAPIVLLLTWRLFDGMFNRNDPEQFGWWLVFITIIGVIGGAILMFPIFNN